MQVSRRTILALSGSIVALATGATLWKSRSSTGGSLQTAPRRASERLVDHNGWMLTAADKKKILERQPSAPAAPSSDADADTDAP